MAELNETPSGNRIRISFFGRRNAGKSTLVNALTGQPIALVSDVAGTTTDPVSKAMEILPLGPCLITDTAGLDDEGALGEARVKRSLDVLEATDVAVWVTTEADPAADAAEARFRAACAARGIVCLRFLRGDSVEGLKAQIAAIKQADAPRALVADLVRPGATVVCVCPIDESAPKGRLILPQQQVIREILDGGAAALVCQPQQVAALCAQMRPQFVITDSQAFGPVAKAVPPDIPLTGFSIVFARAKGDLASYCAGAEAMKHLKDGDRVLVAEGCTHHRQCNDIGTTKLPNALRKKTGKALEFTFCSGADFPDEAALGSFALVVHCGGCMLTRRVVQMRLARCRAAGVAVTNYGIVLAAAQGIQVSPETCMVARSGTAKG